MNITLTNQSSGISKIKEIEQIILFASKLHFLSVDTPRALMCAYVYVCFIYCPALSHSIPSFSAQLKQLSDFSVVSFAKGDYDGIVSKSLIA